MPVPGPLELIIVLVIALIVLGPGKLPDVGAALGKGIREFRRASSDLQDATRTDSPPNPAPPAAAPPAAAPPAAAPPPAPPAVTTPTPPAPPVASSESTTEAKS
jgi:sec-independent protein translocase protein TatA